MIGDPPPKPADGPSPAGCRLSIGGVMLLVAIAAVPLAVAARVEGVYRLLIAVVAGYYAVWYACIWLLIRGNRPRMRSHRTASPTSPVAASPTPVEARRPLLARITVVEIMGWIALASLGIVAGPFDWNTPRGVFAWAFGIWIIALRFVILMYLRARP